MTIGDYSGGAANRWASYWGKHLVHGGGHAATEDASIYAVAYEDTSASWELIAAMPDLREHGLWYDHGGGNNSYRYFILHGAESTMPDNPDDPDGWALPDDHRLNPREIFPGWPGSAHTYDTLRIIPPEWAGNPQGALLRHGSFGVGIGGGRYAFMAHRFRLGATTWDRFEASTTMIQTSSIDSRRGRAKFPNSRGYRDLATGSWVDVAGKVMGLPTGYNDNRLSEYHEQRDIHAFCDNTQEETQAEAPSNWVWWPGGDDNGVRHLVTWTGTAPPNISGGKQTGQASLVYIDALEKFCFFSLADADAYYLIDVPEDPRQPWSAIRVAIFGEGRPSQLVSPAGHVYRRWDWLPALKSISYIPLTGNTGARVDKVVLIRVVE